MLILPSSSAGDLLLYSAKEASTTGFHQDLTATGDPSRSDSALVLREWATSLNLTGSFIHDLKQRDFESAERGIQQYLSSGQKLKDLVIQLDMTDTYVATFQDDNDVNMRSLHELLNQTREFEELQAAEAAFRDQKNISGLESVKLQGENLRTEIHSNYEEYADRSDRVVSISGQFDLDVSAFEQSITDFAAILAEIDAVQDARSTAINEMIQDFQAASPISVNIFPHHGVYGDTLSIAGGAYAPAGTEVRVFVDGVQVGGVMTGNDGHFSHSYRIEKIEARNHTAFVSVGSDISDVSNFTVEGANTTISLDARLGEEDGASTCIGTGRLLTEGGVPVRGARISMTVAGRASREYGITGDDGAYTLTAQHLSPGVHTLKTRFDPGGFPLNGSESAPVTIEGPSHFDLLAALVYLVAIGGAAVGGVLFLRDRHPADAPPSADTMVTSARLVEPPSMPTIEEARMMADQVTVTKEGWVDGGETVALTYRRLVQELEAKYPDLRLRSRTPRNLAVLFADRPFGDQLGVLVGIHERIMYAEHEPREDDLHQMREAFISIITEGDGH